MGHSDVNSGCFITMFISRCDLYSMGSRISAFTVSGSLILYLIFLSPGDAPDSTITFPFSRISTFQFQTVNGYLIYMPNSISQEVIVQPQSHEDTKTII